MIFDFTNYKQFLEIEVSSRKMTLKDFCAATHIQPPYLTKVLRHDAHLTEEQIFAISRFFALSEEEETFFLLLLRFARTSSRPYKQRLKEQIHAIRKEHADAHPFQKDELVPTNDSEAMKLIEYYLSPNQQAIYKALHIPKYRNNPYLLCQKLEVLDSEIDDTLVRLDKLRLISRSGHHISVLGPEPQLREGHALMAHHHKNWRIEALKRYFPRHADNLKVTETLSVDAKSLAALRQKLKKLVEEAESQSRHGSSQVVQLNVDLFVIC